MSLLAQDPRLTRRVGALALAVIVGAFVFFVFLYDRIELGARTRIKVYLGHGAGLREGAELVAGGQRIGRVESVENVLHGASDVLAGEVGIVATVAIDGDETWKVPADSVLFVTSRGPLAPKYLEVAPPTRDAAPGPPIAEGARVRAIDPPSLDNVVQRMWTNTTIVRAFLAEVGPELTAFRTQLRALAANLDAIASSDPRLAALALGMELRGLVAEAEKTYDVGLGGADGFARFRATVSAARTTLAQARGAIERLEPLAARLGGDVTRIAGAVSGQAPGEKLEAILAQAKVAIAKIDPLLAQVDELNARIARGEGSMGRLMKDPEFPEDAKELGKIMKRRPWRIIAKPKD